MASLRSSSPAAMALAHSWRILSSIMRGEALARLLQARGGFLYSVKVSHHKEVVPVLF
jgi:hypothetical protein